MNFLAILKVAMRALGRNKMRSALTMLGIIIGVGAVIAMVSVGQGAQSMVHSTERVNPPNSPRSRKLSPIPPDLSVFLDGAASNAIDASAVAPTTRNRSASWARVHHARQITVGSQVGRLRRQLGRTKR